MSPTPSILALIAAAVSLVVACASTPPSPVGTADEREALLHAIVAKTLARTAWSPYTAGQPEKTFPRTADALIAEFRAADTDHALLLALIKLSNLRHDRHLSVELEYQQGEPIWAGHAAKRYPDFTRLLETLSFDAYVHTKGRKVVVLDWRGFERSAPSDIDRLMTLASARNLLDHAVYFDGTTSGGGARGAYVLARLSARPFKTTLGNLRLSDVTADFIADVKLARAGAGIAEQRDAGARLVEWLEHDVSAAWKQGEAYSPVVPFKLAELAKDSDGTMQPAPLHFTGGLAASFSSFGGSHLDQFAAMIIDNRLGYTVGMPAGGYSNTWEWTETLRLPNGRPLASFMWNIGHTIRPNGEILEGNAALVDDPVPMTRENFATYSTELLARVLAHFENTRAASPRISTR